jgi:protein Mpv17
MNVQFLFPFQGWWVVPVKVAFDQTIWSAIWNSLYFIALGLLRFESPVRIFKDLKETFFPLLTVRYCSPVPEIMLSYIS